MALFRARSFPHGPFERRERKGAVRRQTHIIQVAPLYKRQKKSVIPSGGLAVFRSQVQGGPRPAQRARN